MKKQILMILRKDAVVNIHRTENSNLKQLIPLKMEELQLYQEMFGEGIEDIPKEEIKEKNNISNNNENEEENKKQKILLKLIKNFISNYGSLDSLFNKDNITLEDKKNIMAINEKLNSEEKNNINNTNNDNNVNNNEGTEGKLEYVISNNPDNLDIKLNQYLLSIYSENRTQAIIFKKIEGNTY